MQKYYFFQFVFIKFYQKGGYRKEKEKKQKILSKITDSIAVNSDYGYKYLFEVLQHMTI